MITSPSRLFSTYSIVARDPDTGELGAAVQTHQMTVGNFVPWLEAGAGAVATQALGNIRFGPLGLELLRQGIEAQKVIDALVASDEGAASRQVAVVDHRGGAAAWTGESCIPNADHHVGAGFSVQANMMTGTGVIPAMVEAFTATPGVLAERMLAALEAAEAQGGDIRGSQSSALRVVPGSPREFEGPDEWRPLYDLRVDEHSDPVGELGRLVRLRRGQLISQEGHRALETGGIEEALEKWEEARHLAPELEEIAFWQAMDLADKPSDLQGAMAILAPMLKQDPLSRHWIDLIGRLEKAGLFEREGAAAEILHAIEGLADF